MIEKQIENGNRWAHIATFLHGRTENQVKNRFKHMLRTFVEDKYGKEYFLKNSKEILQQNPYGSATKDNRIIEELYQFKTQELQNNQEKGEKSSPILSKSSGGENSSNPNQDNEVSTSMSAFKKLNSNLTNYSRNVPKLHQLHSQPHYINYNLDYGQFHMRNLNADAINLNNSMYMVNPMNCSYEHPANMMNAGLVQQPTNLNKTMDEAIKPQTVIKPKLGSGKPKATHKRALNDLLSKNTVPRTSIDLAQLSNDPKMMIKQESHEETVENIQSEFSRSLKITEHSHKNDSGEDVNMECPSDTSFNAAHMPMPSSISIAEIKQNAVRKFIDSDNDENLYVMKDGSLFVECIRTSMTKRLSHPYELMFPLKNSMPVDHQPQGDVAFPQMHNPNNRTVNVDLDELQNHIMMLNYQNHANATSMSQLLAYLQHKN
jgi:hypothetical protein